MGDVDPYRKTIKPGAIRATLFSVAKFVELNDKKNNDICYSTRRFSGVLLQLWPPNSAFDELFR